MAVLSRLNLNKPQEICDAGERIYNEQYKAEYEQKHLHEFVAIDVLGGSATLGATTMEAVGKAQELHPEGFFHLIRVGHVAAFEHGRRPRHPC
jgi:hypothetical protein